MSDTGERPAFDDSSRAAIRRRLLHYMTEHRIGVIRLADRISKANRRNPEIPIKTLQRFIAGNFRTSDMYVGFFQQFAKDLREPDPIGELGKAMVTFLNAKGSERYAGNFMSSMSGGAGADRIRYQSEWSVTPDREFCRVVERSQTDKLVVCDGVLVGRENMAVVALQDRTTKVLRQYLITADGDGYAAMGTEAVFSPGSDDPVRALSGRVGPFRAAANMSGVVSEVEWARLKQRQRHAGSPLPRRRRLLEKLAGAFRRPTVHPPRVEDADHSDLTGPDHDVRSISDEFREYRIAEVEEPVGRDQLQAAFLVAAERADEPRLRQLVEQGADVNEPDPATGLTALHLSVGRNAIGAVRFLVEHGAAFVPDKLGRMPSTIAAESEVSEELCDYIAEAEARAEGV